jgi:hypothetical protein
MIWQAKVEDTRPAGSQYDTRVHLSNNEGGAFRERFFNDGTLPNLRQKVLAWIEEYEDRESKTVTIPEGTLIDCTPVVPVVVPPPAPTQEELDRTAFLKAWRRLLNLRAALGAGLITSTNRQLTDTTDEVRARWDASYLDLLES